MSDDRNDHSDDHAPEPVDIDAAISADLDGEFDALAFELDREPSGFLSELESRNGYADRRAALERTRDAVRTPVEPLDDLTRRRLLTRATAETGVARATGARPWATRLAAVAAVLVVVVLGAGVLASLPSSDDAERSSSGGASTTARTGNLGDLGDVSDARTLDNLLRDRTEADEPRNDAASPEASKSADSASGIDGFHERVLGDVDGASPEQVQACSDQYRAQGTVRFTGSGVYRGQAAVVLGIAAGDRTIVFVLAAVDCNTVLFSVSR